MDLNRTNINRILYTYKHFFTIKVCTHMTYDTSKAFCILVIYVVWNWISRIHSFDLFSELCKCSIDWFDYAVYSDYCVFVQSEHFSFMNCPPTQILCILLGGCNGSVGGSAMQIHLMRGHLYIYICQFLCIIHLISQQRLVW